jgi:hypothetical protein
MENILSMTKFFHSSFPNYFVSRITVNIEPKINGKLKKVTEAAVACKSLAVKGVKEPTNRY